MYYIVIACHINIRYNIIHITGILERLYYFLFPTIFHTVDEYACDRESHVNDKGSSSIISIFSGTGVAISNQNPSVKMIRPIIYFVNCINVAE